MQFSPAPHKLGYDLHDTEIANLMITFPVAFMGICINAAEQSRVQPYAFVCPPTASSNFIDSVEGGGDEMPRLLAFVAPVAMSLTILGLCLLAFNHLGVGYPAATYDLGPIPKLQKASQDFNQRFVTPVLVDCCLRCPLLPCLPALSSLMICLVCLVFLPSWLLPSLLLLPCLPALSIAAFVAHVALYCLVSHSFMIHPGNHQILPGTENTTPGKKPPREPETPFREPETQRPRPPRALSPSLVFLHDGCFRCSYGLVSQPCFPS
jgi:hypothetical protein